MCRTSRNNALCLKSLEQALEKSPETYGHLDLIAFGFPCQDISNANPKGKGLKGEKSSLFFEGMRIVNILTPQWLLIENVPRLLSINEGKDFATVLSTLSKSGYGYSWRILDSQYFGLAQRRKRLFIVGHFGAECPPEILFEQKGGGGNDKAKPKIQQRGLCLSTRTGERQNPTAETYIVNTITAKSYGDKGWANRNEWNSVIASTLGQSQNPDPNYGTHFVAQTLNQGRRGNSSYVWQDTYIEETNAKRKGKIAGIPRGLDTCRGIVIGNAVSVPVAQWIGKRIKDYVLLHEKRKMFQPG